jgi:hypothetical protein
MDYLDSANVFVLRSRERLWTFGSERIIRLTGSGAYSSFSEHGVRKRIALARQDRIETAGGNVELVVLA